MRQWVTGVAALVTVMLAVGASPGGANTRVATSETSMRAEDIRISAGLAHTCAVIADGTVRCWGANDQGQLGDGTTTTPEPNPVPVSGLANAVAVAAGSKHTCALRADGTVVCWGANNVGQLGSGTPTTPRLLPVPVSGLSNAVALAAGAFHTCALQVDGHVRCWGNNASGQLGDGTTANQPAPVLVSGLTNAVAMAAGSGHSCALRADGMVLCWGQNDKGQLGTGTTMPQPTPVLPVSFLSDATALAAGAFHTSARTARGNVLCWGAGSSGQLGTGGTTDAPTPQGVALLTDAVAVAAGAFHTCARRGDGTVACWGANGSGQLGDGTTTPQPTPVAVPAFGNVVAVAAGAFHTCALQADDRARCWGKNSSGQLGDGTTSDRTKPSVVAGSGGSISGRGISAGDVHSCARRAAGTAACWGNNANAQLGDGTTTDRKIPTGVVFRVTGSLGLFFDSPLRNLVALAAGELHSCAVAANGQPFCWGSNFLGALGIGTLEDQSTAVAVPSFLFNIDPAVELQDDGRVAIVTALMHCPKGRHVQAHVKLTQGETVGQGAAAGACTGALARYPATVPAEGSAAFVPGPAWGWAHATVQSQFRVVDTQEWERGVELEPEP